MRAASRARKAAKTATTRDVPPKPDDEAPPLHPRSPRPQLISLSPRDEFAHRCPSHRAGEESHAEGSFDSLLLLKWKIRDSCLFQVEFAFYAPTCFIGDLAVSQQPVDVFAFGGNQFRP